MECSEKVIDGMGKGLPLLAAGMDWHLSPEDGRAHWGKEVSARKCGELEGVEIAVVCGRNFVIVKRSA
jgi:hypothetical protein